VLNKQATNTNASIFCFEATIYCNLGEQVNHYTSNVIHLEQNISVYQTKIKSKLKVIKKSIKTDHHQLVFNKDVHCTVQCHCHQHSMLITHCLTNTGD
jgi:hypothetical protein